MVSWHGLVWGALGLLVCFSLLHLATSRHVKLPPGQEIDEFGRIVISPNSKSKAINKENGKSTEEGQADSTQYERPALRVTQADRERLKAERQEARKIKAELRAAQHKEREEKKLKQLDGLKKSKEAALENQQATEKLQLEAKEAMEDAQKHIDESSDPKKDQMEGQGKHVESMETVKGATARESASKVPQSNPTRQVKKERVERLFHLEDENGNTVSLTTSQISESLKKLSVSDQGIEEILDDLEREAAKLEQQQTSTPPPPSSPYLSIFPSCFLCLSICVIL